MTLRDLLGEGVISPAYVPHYHQDDSGVFECLLGSSCKYKDREAPGFTAPTAEAIATAKRRT